MKERTKAYVAGLLDAEGTLSVKKQITEGNKYSGVVAIDNTDFCIGQWLVDTFGGNIQTVVNEDSADSCRWQTQGAEHAVWFLSTVLPYLVIKKQEAEMLLGFYSLGSERCPEKREEYYRKERKLKDRSVETETKEFSWKSNLVNAYFAGLFDGEGSLGIYKETDRVRPRYKNYVQLPNNFVSVLLAMPNIYGGSVKLSKESEGNQKAKYLWRLCHKERIELFLLKMLPYLRIKREHAKSLLSFVRLPKFENGDDKANEIREDFYCRLTAMNIKPKYRENKIQSELMSDHAKCLNRDVDEPITYPARLSLGETPLVLVAYKRSYIGEHPSREIPREDSLQ